MPDLRLVSRGYDESTRGNDDSLKRMPVVSDFGFILKSDS